MPANYTAVDALTYVREHLGNTLNWVHDTLADVYDLEMIGGEEYLPEPLSEVMAALHDLHRQATDEAVAVGAYMRGGERLYRPRVYSTGHPVYANRTVGEAGEQVHATSLEHPSGSPRPRGTRRAGLVALQGGGDCA